MTTPFTVTLQASGRSFACGPGESVLDAALRAGLNLPHQCKSGSCGACRAEVLAGDTAVLMANTALSPTAEARGMRLLCCTAAASDLQIDCRELPPGQAVRKLPVRVQALERAADDVMVLRLAPPAGQSLAYQPGQYIDVLLPGGLRRSYSLASAVPVPGDDGQGALELHVRRQPGGLFTEQVFTRLKVRDVLRLEGPFGAFGLGPDDHRPLLLLATGTGFAPVKALVEALAAQGGLRPVTLYWGGRSLADLYHHALCLQWAQAHAGWLRYVPVLSRPADGWQGHTGHVQHAVRADHAHLGGHAVYACGSPAMVADARALLVTEGGLDADDFFADAFTHAAPAVPTAAVAPA